jgi:hypothetical protein
VDAKVQGADRNSLVDAVEQRSEIEVVGQEHRGEAVAVDAQWLAATVV